MTNGSHKKILNHLHADAFLIAGGGFSSLSDGEKGCPARIFKHGYSFLLRFFFLLFSGSITLKLISYYFHNYLFKAYKCLNPYFEKPGCVLFQRYRRVPLFLPLKQWKIANEGESLIQVHYASKPRDPE